jgi:hypothetical protein
MGEMSRRFKKFKYLFDAETKVFILLDKKLEMKHLVALLLIKWFAPNRLINQTLQSDVQDWIGNSDLVKIQNCEYFKILLFTL